MNKKPIWSEPYYGIEHILNVKRGVHISVCKRTNFSEGYILNFGTGNGWTNPVIDITIDTLEDVKGELLKECQYLLT